MFKQLNRLGELISYFTIMRNLMTLIILFLGSTGGCRGQALRRGTQVTENRWPLSPQPCGTIRALSWEWRVVIGEVARSIDRPRGEA